MRALSIREQLFRAVEELLETMPQIACLRRLATGEADVFPDINIDDGGDRPLGQSNYTQSVTLSLNLIMSVAQPAQVEAGADMGRETHFLLNELDADVRDLMLRNMALGGLATNMTLGPLDVQISPGAATRSIAGVRSYFIDYTTLTENARAISDL